jgi:hypothetical protein
MTLTAIAPGRSEALRERLETLPLGAGSPFARLDHVHFARFVIIDKLADLGPPPEVRDTLKNEYLLFSTDFDRPLERFLDAVCEQMPEEADAVWGLCVGYPGTADREAFARYMRHNQIETTFPFSAYPDASLPEVREALELRSRFVEFAVRSQGMDAAELHEAYRREFGEPQG